LKKLDEKDDYAAIILAAAGLKRMGWESRISQILGPEDCMYAVGQEGGCSVPVAVHTEVKGSMLYLTGAVYSLDGADCLKDTMQTVVEIDNKVRVKYTYIRKFGVSMIFYFFFYHQDIITFIPTYFNQVSESAQECVHVGVTANSVSSSALEAAEKLGMDLANALLNKGAKDILTTARKLNDAR
ncbi:hypothetical protein cypCar_00032987, partial [Cyprinus carpio]